MVLETRSVRFFRICFPGIARVGLKFSTNFPVEVVCLFLGQEMTFANEQLTKNTFDRII